MGVIGERGAQEVYIRLIFTRLTSFHFMNKKIIATSSYFFLSVSGLSNISDVKISHNGDRSGPYLP